MITMLQPARYSRHTSSLDATAIVADSASRRIHMQAKGRRVTARRPFSLTASAQRADYFKVIRYAMMSATFCWSSCVP
jgi:hypothetical protein